MLSARAGWSADRTALVLTSIAGALVFGILAWPLLRGEVYYQNDLGEMHLAYRAFYAECLERGERFEWFPGLHCGYYVHGEGQAGMYHPLHLLLYRTIRFDLALDVEILAGYAFAFAGTFAFLGRWGLGRGAALFGGFLFAFSGFNLLHLTHVNAVAVAAHVPWLLVALDVSIRSEDPRAKAFAGAAVALLTGSQILLGYPQYLYFSGLAEAGYAIAVSAGRRGRLVALVGHKLAGILVGGAQLLPTLDALSASTRAAPEQSFGTFLSLHPVNLVQLVGPYFFRDRTFGGYPHETGLYGGAVVLALVVHLWARRTDLGPRRPLAAFALVLGLGGLVLALGGYTGPLYRAWTALPGLGVFRCPTRHIVLVHLALAIGAALALDGLAGRPGDRRGTRHLAALPVAAVAVAALSGWSKFEPYTGDLASIVSGPVLLAMGAGFVAAAGRGSRVAFVAVVAIAAIDVAGYGIKHLYRYPPARPLAEVIAREPAPPEVREGRVESSRCLLTVSGHRLTRGYVGLPPRSRIAWGSPAGLRLAGVVWATDSHARARPVVPVEGGLPRFRLLAEAVATDAPWEGLDGLDLERVATLAEPVSLDPGPAGTVEVVADRPGRIALRTSVPGRRLLVVSERHHPGWRVEVDGEPARLLAAYGEFLACEVPAGDAEVSLEFAPESLERGRLATVLGIVLVLLVLARGWGRR